MIKTNLVLWSAVIGAFTRIARYRDILGTTNAYFDRLRIVNEALGPHWVFRLADAVGIETIKENRSSWHQFYVEDADRMHCPLDPCAPETEAFLGRRYSDMDMAFYGGMGFDGYRLALMTPRHVDTDTKQITFDKRYILTPSTELKARLNAYDDRRHIPKQDYYESYGSALSLLYKNINYIVVGNDYGEDILERTAAGCLILLCGGHQGCLKHINPEEEFLVQMESMIIFNHARNVFSGATSLSNSVNTVPLLRTVS